MMLAQAVNSGYSPSLDLFSTSPTKKRTSFLRGDSAVLVFCSYHAPYFAFQKKEKIYGVIQGCCNHWDCPRCGVLRAKQEYGRMVVGIEGLSANYELFFITVTCRGKGLSESEAMQGYLGWTNRLLDAMRIKTKREGKDWYYVQVTEKQKRGHPHSHIISTFNPGDTYEGYVEKWKRIDGVLVNERVSCLRSDWLQAQCIRSGLGEQYDLSVVRTASAASRYVAKYLFKNSMFTTKYPPGWKRIRYSQTFPKLPEKETNAFVLLTKEDWFTLAAKAAVITTDNEQTKAEVLYNLSGHDVLVS